MGQVAFDTLKFVKKLELAGVPAKQAEAFSEAVRESHEAVDVATKRDLEDAKKEVLSQVTAVKRDLEDVRKDLSAEIANVRKEMDARFDKVDARFDKINDKFEKLGMQMTIRLGLMVAAGVSIIAAILKM